MAYINGFCFSLGMIFQLIRCQTFTRLEITLFHLVILQMRKMKPLWTSIPRATLFILLCSQWSLLCKSARVTVVLRLTMDSLLGSAYLVIIAKTCTVPGVHSWNRWYLKSIYFWFLLIHWLLSPVSSSWQVWVFPISTLKPSQHWLVSQDTKNLLTLYP